MTSTLFSQGAETLYGSVVKPVFLSMSAKTSPSAGSYETSTSADTLRDRAAAATSE